MLEGSATEGSGWEKWGGANTEDWIWIRHCWLMNVDETMQMRIWVWNSAVVWRWDSAGCRDAEGTVHMITCWQTEQLNNVCIGRWWPGRICQSTSLNFCTIWLKVQYNIYTLFTNGTHQKSNQSTKHKALPVQKVFVL